MGRTQISGEQMTGQTGTEYDGVYLERRLGRDCGANQPAL